MEKKECACACDGKEKEQCCGGCACDGKEQCCEDGCACDGKEQCCEDGCCGCEGEDACGCGGCGCGCEAEEQCCEGCGCGCEHFDASDMIHLIVQQGYGRVGRTAPVEETAASNRLGKHFGYSEEELKKLPPGANLGLQCGNPQTYANLKEGESVLDLGSGSGLDCFLAAKAVGPTGKVVGLDMTQSMLDRSARLAKEHGYSNVEFVEGYIEKMPLPDNTFDCIISNCVINLCADKEAVFQNMFSVLKSGGRIAVSDVLLKRPLPDSLLNADSLCACIAGSIPVFAYKELLEESGFVDVEVYDKNLDLNVWKGTAGCCGTEDACCGGSSEGACCGGSSEGAGCCGGDSSVSISFQGDLNEFIASGIITARKP